MATNGVSLGASIRNVILADTRRRCLKIGLKEWMRLPKLILINH